MISEAGPVLLGAALTGFATLFVVVLVFREARLHEFWFSTSQLTLAFFAMGGAASLLRHRTRCSDQSTSTVDRAVPAFALHALWTAISLLLASMIATKLERWREFLALRSLAPPLVLQGVLVGPLLLAASLVGSFAASALIGLHEWHRSVLHLRLRVAVLWTALLIAALIGAWVAALVQDAGRYWHIPGILAFAAAAAAAMQRKSASAAREVRREPGWPRENRATWAVLAALLGAVLAVSVLRPTSEMPAATGRTFAIHAIAMGAALGLLLSRICWRMQVGVEFAPLALPLAAFAALPGAASPLGASVAAALLLAALALQTRHVARAAHSIPHGLACVGGFACVGFAMLAGVVSVTGDNASQFTVRLLVLCLATVAACVLVLRERDGTAAKSACVTAGSLSLLTAPFSGSANATTALDDAFSSKPATFIRDKLIGEATAFVPASGRQVMQAEPGGRLVEMIVIPSDAGVEIAADPPLLLRMLRRAGRQLLPGGRLIIELVDDDDVRALIRRYAAKTNPALGAAFSLHIETPADRYDAILIGFDVPHWLRECALGENSTVGLQPYEVHAEPNGK